jgi:hypothetical protein
MSGKRLSALGLALAFFLTSCGGSSTSSNSGRTKNAAIQNGLCVLTADDVAARDASMATLALAEATYNDAVNTAYNLYYEKLNVMQEEFYSGYYPYYNSYYDNYFNIIMPSPYYNGYGFYNMYYPYYNMYMGGYYNLQMVFQSAQINAKIELRATERMASREYSTAVDIANAEATAREQQYLADCGELVVAAHADYEKAVAAANVAYEADIAAIAGSADALKAASSGAVKAYEDSLKNLQTAYESAVSKAALASESCVKAGTTQADCDSAKDAAIATALSEKESATTKAKTDLDSAVAALDTSSTATAAAQAKRDAAIAAAAEVRSAALANVAIPNEPSITVPVPPAEPEIIDAPVPPLPSANPGDPAPSADPPVATPIEAVPVQLESELDSVVTSQVQESTTVTCSESCVDALQFSARTEGDVYFQYTSEGKVDNDAWVKVESGQKFESSKLNGGIAIQVRPTDLSDPITLIKDVDKPNFTEVSAGSTEEAGSMFNLVNILIVLVLLVIVLFIVGKRRKKATETK